MSCTVELSMKKTFKTSGPVSYSDHGIPVAFTLV